MWANSSTGSTTEALRGNCPAPFFSSASFSDTGGFIDGRLCHSMDGLDCCLPCPLVDYVYPDNFGALTRAANWVSVVGTVAALFLLLSWAFLPVDRTHRHYLSISLTLSVVFMNLGFIIPLVSEPEQCFNQITPNDMATSRVCASSGAFLLLGGWAGVMWAFLRSLSLHLQICWQVTVGRPFMVAAHAAGWGIPILGVVLALVLSGVSFRFGTTCHINHENSLADFWVPLLVFSGLTLVITALTFFYCVKVYLASLADGSASTRSAGSSALPSYSYATSLRTMSPRQAYRRVRRVVQLQWRGIAIVLIIIADVIFFSVVFVFQDNTIQEAQDTGAKVQDWALCLIAAAGDKNRCLAEADALAVGEATVTSVLLLLALNGIWLLFLMGRRDMIRGWVDLVKGLVRRSRRREFVSFDARFGDQKGGGVGGAVGGGQSSYEMLSGGSSAALVTRSPAPLSSVKSSSSLSPSPSPPSLSSTPAGLTERELRSAGFYPKPILQRPAPTASARYHPHSRSFSSPRPPQSQSQPREEDGRSPAPALIMWDDLPAMRKI